MYRPATPSPRARRLVSLAIAASLLGFGATAAASNYVFATFKGDTAPGEKLSIYTSTDALNFTLVADTGFAGTSGTLRDPTIMKYTDGKYYVAYTDPPTSSCCGKENHFSIASSSDLITWTNVTTVDAGVPGAAHTWAPEWFVDGGTVKIVANIDTLNNDTDFQPYVFTAQNGALTSWSGPVALGIGPNYIDAFVMIHNGTYHAFLKNETTRYVEHATASSLTGPWKFVGTGDWAGWGSGMEGPDIVQLDDGTWRIFLDGQGSVGFLYATSPDLMKWSATKPLPALSDVVRHGTVARETPFGSTSSSTAAASTASSSGTGSGGSTTVGGGGAGVAGGGPSNGRGGGGAGGSSTASSIAAGNGAAGGRGGGAGTASSGVTSGGGGKAGIGGAPAIESASNSMAVTSSAGAAGAPDAEPSTNESSGGCGCHVTEKSSPTSRWAILGLLALAVASARRGRKIHRPRYALRSRRNRQDR